MRIYNYKDKKWAYDLMIIPQNYKFSTNKEESATYTPCLWDLTKPQLCSFSIVFCELPPKQQFRETKTNTTFLLNGTMHKNGGKTRKLTKV